MSPRIHDRFPLQLAVQYRTAGAFLVAYTTNLSRGGLFIEAPPPTALPAPGTAMTVLLEVPGMSAPLEVTGRVVWVRTEAGGESGVAGAGEADAADKPRGFGVQLDDFDHRYGTVVDQLVARFDRLKIAVIAWGAASRAQIVRYLRSILTCEVLECSGADAARTAFGAPVDMAVIDLDSCPEDGLALLDLAGAPPSHTPVVVLAKDEGMRARALELGAAAALGTPPTFEALQGAILRTLSRPAAVRTAPQT